MTSPCAFGLGLAVGALSVVACLHLGARIAGRHVLALKE